MRSHKLPQIIWASGSGSPSSWTVGDLILLVLTRLDRWMSSWTRIPLQKKLQHYLAGYSSILAELSLDLIFSEVD